jgi:hypothetical protein
LTSGRQQIRDQTEGRVAARDHHPSRLGARKDLDPTITQQSVWCPKQLGSSAAIGECRVDEAIADPSEAQWSPVASGLEHCDRLDRRAGKELLEGYIERSSQR